MDVNNFLRSKFADEFVRQHLHVPGEHDEIGPLLTNHRNLFLLCFAFRVFGDWNNEIGNTVKLSQALVVRVVGDDQRNITGQFTDFVPVKQIAQAMVNFGYQYCISWAWSGASYAPFHANFSVGGLQLQPEIFQVDLEATRIELNAHEE